MNEKRTINPLTYPLANLSTPQLVHLPNIVSFSVRNLTLWVPFLSTNCSPCRKKSILAKVCFDAKQGKIVHAAKWIFI